MHVELYELDTQLAFLHGEISRLRNSFPGAGWAKSRAESLEAIRETLRQLRRAKQMAGVADVAVE